MGVRCKERRKKYFVENNAIQCGNKIYYQKYTNGTMEIFDIKVQVRTNT